MIDMKVNYLGLELNRQRERPSGSDAWPCCWKKGTWTASC
jgi:hypothetical protein